MTRLVASAAAAAFMFGAFSSAQAADLPGRKMMPAAPAASTSCKETSSSAVSSDIFGFTTGSDVADQGTWSVAGTYVGSFKGAGYKPGSYSGQSGAIQATTSFLPCWEFAPYILGAINTGSFRGVPGDIKQNTYGIGLEQKYKLLGRGTHGIGLTLDWDINYQGYDQKDTTLIPALSTNGGLLTSSYRLFLDRELIPGKLWFAFNVNWDQTWQERPAIIAPGLNSDWTRTSVVTFAGSLSYQLVDGLYLGAEARYLRTHNGNFFNTFTGDALFVGPTFYWQATKALFVSGAYNIQVGGNTPNVVNGVAVAAPIASSNLNLVTASQHLVRLKVGYAF